MSRLENQKLRQAVSGSAESASALSSDEVPKDAPDCSKKEGVLDSKLPECDKREELLAAEQRHEENKSEVSEESPLQKEKRGGARGFEAGPT